MQRVSPQKEQNSFQNFRNILLSDEAVGDRATKGIGGQIKSRWGVDSCAIMPGDLHPHPLTGGHFRHVRITGGGIDHFGDKQVAKLAVSQVTGHGKSPAHIGVVLKAAGTRGSDTSHRAGVGGHTLGSRGGASVFTGFLAGN